MQWLTAANGKDITWTQVVSCTVVGRILEIAAQVKTGKSPGLLSPMQKQVLALIDESPVFPPWLHEALQNANALPKDPVSMIEFTLDIGTLRRTSHPDEWASFLYQQTHSKESTGLKDFSPGLYYHGNHLVASTVVTWQFLVLTCPE